MKKLLLVVLLFTLFACSNAKKEEGLAKEDIDKFISMVDEKVHSIVDVTIADYESLKDKLTNDVTVAKTFVKEFETKIQESTTKALAEAKALTVDNPELKKLNNELIGFLGQKEAAAKKLVKAIVDGVQEDYIKAKEELEKIIKDLNLHKTKINNLR